MSAPEISMVDVAAWDEARRNLPVIRRLAENPARKRTDVLAAADELGCGPTHVYALLRRYLADARLTSLLPRRRGPEQGISLLDQEVDALINEVIDDVYLTRQQPRIVHLVDEVRRRCMAAGLAAPSRKTITARLQMRPAREVVTKREGRKAARDRYLPVVGSLEAHWPLSLIQIDHTLVDVIVVDSVARKPISAHG
jgi:putative transposase